MVERTKEEVHINQQSAISLSGFFHTLLNCGMKPSVIANCSIIFAAVADFKLHQTMLAIEPKMKTRRSLRSPPFFAPVFKARKKVMMH